MAVKINGAPLEAPPPPSSQALGAVFDKHIPANPLAAPPQQYQSKPALAQIAKELLASKQVIEQDSHQETLHPGILSSEPLCEVMVEGSRTVNLGNFESARIAVSVRLPCPKAQLAATYDEGVAWVNDRLVAMVGEVKGK